jgi:hypothetical protein
MREHKLNCDCLEIEHSMFFTIDDDTDLECMYVNTFLAEHGFFLRVINAIKYIFGYKCKFGHFEETVVSISEAKKLRDFLNEFIGEECKS